MENEILSREKLNDTQNFLSKPKLKGKLRMARMFSESHTAENFMQMYEYIFKSFKIC